jgi:serine/threonine protein kinase
LKFSSILADYECSIGVVGTQFWRAPEILLGAKNKDNLPSSFIVKSVVYSYAMTCYDVLTGKFPFEDLGKDLQFTDYDHVLKVERPVLPSGTKTLDPVLVEYMLGA